MEDQSLNPLEHKTAAGYLEYILQSEGELLWMHFDEAQRIESVAKDECFDDGFSQGVRETTSLLKKQITEVLQNIEKLKFTTDEQ
jgi:hypothetical protein